MAKSPGGSPKIPQKSAVQRERFASHEYWEALREADVTLDALRANASAIDASARLFGNRRFNPLHLRVQRAQLRYAVRALALDEPVAARLFADARLISAWYLLPARRAYMGTDAGSDLAALVEVAKAAEAFANLAFTSVQAAQELILAIPHGDGSAFDDLDVQRLHYELRVLVAAAASIRERVRPVAGRARDSRRDRTLGLIAAAVSEATGEAPTMSRGTNAHPTPHFNNASGRFVLSVLSLLGWSHERILASAFERQRRAQYVKV